MLRQKKTYMINFLLLNPFETLCYNNFSESRIKFLSFIEKQEDILMAGISLRNIKKVYPGGVEVIPDLNLEIKDKEFIILVGPSGCADDVGYRRSRPLARYGSRCQRAYLRTYEGGSARRQTVEGIPC